MVYAYIKGYIAIGVDLTIINAVSIIIASAMILVMNNPTHPLRRTLIAINMIVFHGIWQILLVTTWFAYMAARGWILADATFCVILVCAYLQVPKLERWLQGKF